MTDKDKIIKLLEEKVERLELELMIERAKQISPPVVPVYPIYPTYPRTPWDPWTIIYTNQERTGYVDNNLDFH